MDEFCKFTVLLKEIFKHLFDKLKVLLPLVEQSAAVYHAVETIFFNREEVFSEHCKRRNKKHIWLLTEFIQIKLS